MAREHTFRHLAESRRNGQNSRRNARKAPRQPKGARTGGRLATAVRSEPTSSVAPEYSPRATAEGRPASARSAARRLLETVRTSGQLARMVGTSRINAAAVMDASRDDARLDGAIDALAEQERRSPGQTDEKAARFLLAHTLIHQHRAAA